MEENKVLSQEEIDAMLASNSPAPVAQADPEPVAPEAAPPPEPAAEQPVVAQAPPEPAAEQPVVAQAPPVPAAEQPVAAQAPLEPAAPAVPPPAPAPAAANDVMEKLAERLQYLEQVAASGAGSPGDQEAITQLQQNDQSLLGQLEALNSKIDSIMVSLQATVGFGAGETFVCTDCKSKGMVAAKLNCTSCGKDNWWGWFPPKK